MSALEMGVDLGAYKNGDARKIKPEQQHDDGAYGPVRNVILSNIRYVEFESERDGKPQRDRD